MSEELIHICECGKKTVIKLPNHILKQHLLSFIEEQIDKGNVVGGGFSAGICLSDLKKILEKKVID